jgi:hypothetical protein
MHHYTLQDESTTGGVDAFYRGELRLGLKFVPGGGSKPTGGGTLVVDVKQAKELPAMNGETADSAVKLHLLPNRKSSGKRKTGVIKNNLNPVWEEKFTYENVSLEELLHERVLEISVWNYEKSGNTFIGGVRVGPSPGSAAKPKNWMDSIGDEVTHWEDMLARPGEWVEQWHTLRTSLNPRSVALKTSASTSAAPPPIISSSSSLTAPTEHAQKQPPVAAAVEEKEVKGRVQPSIVSSSDEPFKKIAPATAQVKENRAQISAEISSSETDKSPNLQSTAAPPTKPVFSSSVRNRPNKPAVHTPTESRDVKMIQASLPTRDSETGERLDVKTPSPQLSHRGEGDETPSIRVEEERRTPPLDSQHPQAHSTPIMDLSEASRYTEESPESRQRQVRLVCRSCVTTTYQQIVLVMVVKIARYLCYGIQMPPPPLR